MDIARRGLDRMRVLFTTWAWPSHYFPMVPLAWALRAAGHEVLMASQPDLLPTMRASGLPCTRVGRDLDVVAVYRAGTERVTLAGRETVKPSRRSRLSLYVELALAMADDLLALARSWRPDLIVYDPLTYAGPLVAKSIGVPAARNLFGPDLTSFTKMTGDVPGWSALLQRFGLNDLDLLGVATIDPCPPGLQYPDTVAPTARIHTRYIPYNGLSLVPIALPDRSHRERICLTWGTSIHRLLGQQAFLPGHILRTCARLAEERDAELVLAVTANQRRLIPDPPPNVRIVESVPLNVLLSTCSALVHQGGAGTMLTALNHALPQLVLPQIFDESANAYQLTATGAGLTHPAPDLTPTDLVTAAGDLLDNPAHRDAARRLQREMHHQPAPADTVTRLAQLA
jgi:UDP:flavonoid glycosyltransferase YjiC (YdhE family)